MIVLGMLIVVALLIAYNVYTTYSHDVDTFHYHNVWHYLVVFCVQLFIVALFLCAGYFVGKL